MELFVARHGQTEFNKNELACGGQSDCPLTDLGRQQAHELGVLLADIPLDQVFVSPLKRARETAHIALEGRDVPLTVEPSIIEHRFGVYEGVPIHDAEFSRLRWEYCYRLPGGESLMDVAARLFPFLAELPARFPDQNVLLVCHGALGRVINAYYTSPSVDGFRAFQMNNCQLLHFSVPE